MSSRHSRTLLPCSAVMLRKASQSSLVAASSLGKCPRVLMISCNWLLKHTNSVGRVDQPLDGRRVGEEGGTRSQARRQVGPIMGNFCPQGPCSKASSSASALTAV